MIGRAGGVKVDEAFALRRNHARNHNHRLVEVAQDVISGALVAAALDPLPSDRV